MPELFTGMCKLKKQSITGSWETTVWFKILKCKRTLSNLPQSFDIEMAWWDNLHWEYKVQDVLWRHSGSLLSICLDVYINSSFDRKHEGTIVVKVGGSIVLPAVNMDLSKITKPNLLPVAVSSVCGMTLFCIHFCGQKEDTFWLSAYFFKLNFWPSSLNWLDPPLAQCHTGQAPLTVSSSRRVISLVSELCRNIVE